jgi:endonuclease/exonuclease/phosphatase family metal-dependent hydrolase
LKGNNLNDAFIEKGSGIGVTFYHHLPTLRIDVCLVDKTLETVQCTIPQLFLSDHFPVVSDIKLK